MLCGGTGKVPELRSGQKKITIPELRDGTEKRYHKK